MRLTSAKTCVVPSEKLRDYLLNSAHRDGGSKAIFFGRFGYSRGNIEAFAAALANHARDNDIANQNPTRHGVLYEMTCNLVTPDGRNPCIRTVWIDDGADGARLMTAYPA